MASSTVNPFSSQSPTSKKIYTKSGPTPEGLNVLSGYVEECREMSFLHHKCSQALEHKDKWFFIPSIILSLMVSGLSFTMSGNNGQEATFPYRFILIGSISLVAGVFNVLNNHFKYGEVAIKYDHASKKYDSLSKKIENRLSIGFEDIQFDHYMERLSDKMSRLLDNSPELIDNIVSKYGHSERLPFIISGRMSKVHVHVDTV